MSSNNDAAGADDDAVAQALLIGLLELLAQPQPEPTLLAELRFPGMPPQMISARDLCQGHCACRACQEDRLCLFIHTVQQPANFPLELQVMQFQDFPIAYVRDELLRLGLVVLPPAEPQSQGVPEAVRTALPTVEVSAADVEAKCACSVCLEEEEVGTRVFRLACGHKFHQDCLTPWMTDHNTCPTCRRKIE